MKELISIIVPIYNSARYIRDCVESVLEQTYSHFEMLMIDDGSEDDSRELCRKLCMQDERLRLICKSHRGVSAARNTGIEASKGKYLFFLDSDDIIHPQLLEFLYRLMEEKGAEVGTQRRHRTSEEGFKKPEEWKTEDYNMIENVWLENERALECSVFASQDTALSGIGGKMIKKSALENVRFSEKLTHGEDTLFMYQVLLGGAAAVVLCREWYCYRKHEGGTINQLSVRGCSSIYKAECRIRNQEIERGRMQNARVWEYAILSTIRGWYEAGKKNHDTAIVKFAKSRIAIEKEQGIFLQVNKTIRREIIFAFYSFPFRYMYRLLLITERGIRFLRRLAFYPGFYYRKILNLIHIHRWRVRWAYKNIMWKVKWVCQMTWIITRRSIWKMMDIYHIVLHGRGHLDGE